MALPKFTPATIAALFTKLAAKKAHIVLHLNNVDLLTKDLGTALRLQKKAITDPDLGVLETAAEVLPLLAEVKFLTVVISKKLDIDTTGKDTTAILEEILRKADERGSKTSKDLKDTLEWTREFFDKPEIKEILKSDMISTDLKISDIEKPKSWKDLAGMGKALMDFGKVAVQGGEKLTQEAIRLYSFLKEAKKPSEPKGPPPSAQPDAPKA